MSEAEDRLARMVSKNNAQEQRIAELMEESEGMRRDKVRAEEIAKSAVAKFERASKERDELIDVIAGFSRGCEKLILTMGERE